MTTAKLFKIDEFELTPPPTIPNEEMDRLIDLAKAVKIEPMGLKAYVEKSNEVFSAASFYHNELIKIRSIGITHQLANKSDKIVPHSWHARLATDLELGRTVAVRGPAGNGKSTGCQHVLKSLGYNVYHMDCTDSTTAEQLVGGLQPRPTGDGGLEMAFMPGVLTKAFEDPKGAIQLDEFDALDPRIAMALQSALHRGHGKQRWLSAPDHPAGGMFAAGVCPIVVTMNTWGAGANREYVGRNILDAASMDRFNSLIDTNYENEEDMLIMNNVPKNVAAVIVRDAQSIRTVIGENAMRIVLSTRRLLDIGEAVTVLKCDVTSAWDRDFFSRVQPELVASLKKGLEKNKVKIGVK